VPAVSGEVISAVVEAAIQAPSGDNCQPWCFRWDGDHLRILFLSDRAESLYDIQSLASWISLGAVLTNLRLAATRFGFQSTVELFPAGEPPGTVALLRFKAGSVAADRLAETIPARCVNRRPYRREPLPAGVREELQALAAASSGARLSWVDTEPAKERIAALAAQNDRILFENRALHDGVYGWIRWTRAEAEHRRDGMPADALELSRLERPGMRLLGSWRWAQLAAALRISRVLPARARKIYQRSAAIGLLSVRGDQPADFVFLVGVESVGGLIQDQHLRIVDQRLRQTDAAAKALRQCFDHLVDDGRKTQAIDDHAAPFPAPFAGQCAHIRDEVQEFAHGHFAVARRALGQVSHAGFRGHRCRFNIVSAD